MTQILTWGGIPLGGELTVQGSKNAALPLMAGALLHRGRTVIHNCPKILDVEYMGEILRETGCRVERDGHTLVIDASGVHTRRVSAGYATRLRASVLLMGSLLGREGEAVLPHPGGCLIGRRPIDLHLQAFEKMGAALETDGEKLRLSAGRGESKRRRLRGCDISFALPSVGAAENVILGAVLAEGVTVLRGCALEPEIEELCRFLNGKGAQIDGVGGAVLTITGVDELRDSEYTLMPDRIVAGTYLCAAAGTRGSVRLRGVRPKHLRALTEVLQRSGARIETRKSEIFLDAAEKTLAAAEVETMPYPGFPTDLQSPLMAVLCRANGVSRIRETLFESRFLIAPELIKMGADITLCGDQARIKGVSALHGAPVRARELRGGAALMIAGLMAKGQTTIDGGRFIQRGYEDICRDLAQLGARIKECR